jgi:hypothetical protein
MDLVSRFHQYTLWDYLTNRGTEKILRGFVRRTDPEDVPQRLHTLTGEKTLLAMSMAGNLEATHHDGSAMATAELVRDVNDLDNMTAIREDQPYIHDQKQVINKRMHTSCGFLVHIPTRF